MSVWIVSKTRRIILETAGNCASGEVIDMTTEQLDALHHAKPFQPFTIHLADGTKYEVRHPELIWRTQGGRTIFINLGGEKVAIVDLLLVTQITHGNGANGRRRKRN
jgi:hypothetical protein